MIDWSIDFLIAPTHKGMARLSWPGWLWKCNKAQCQRQCEIKTAYKVLIYIFVDSSCPTFWRQVAPTSRGTRDQTRAPVPNSYQSYGLQLACEMAGLSFLTVAMHNPALMFCDVTARRWLLSSWRCVYFAVLVFISYPSYKPWMALNSFLVLMCR